MATEFALSTVVGAVTFRIRGTAWGKWYGRVASALFISLPVAFYWPWGTAAYLPLAAFSLWAVCLPHDPSGRRWLQQLWTGLAFTMPRALVVALLMGQGWLYMPDGWVPVVMGLAGALKPLCYLLPESNPEARWVPAPFRGRYLWRELTFGAVCGGSTWL